MDLWLKFKEINYPKILLISELTVWSFNTYELTMKANLLASKPQTIVNFPLSNGI